MDTVTQSGPGIGSELKQDARNLGAAAQERLSTEADAHKGEIASQARSVSSALQSAAGQLSREDSPDWLRSALQQGAQAIQRLADTVERKNSGELLEEVKLLGREHPGAFLGARALAGFAAARVFKAGGASASASQGSHGSGGQWASSGGPHPSFSSGSSGYSSQTPASPGGSSYGGTSPQPGSPAWTGGTV